MSADHPDISLSRTPVGRETLAAIDADAAAEPPGAVRPQLDTVSYEERPRAAGARAPLSSAPEAIVIESRAAGRETLAAIEEHLVAEALAARPSARTSRPAPRASARPGATRAPGAASRPEPARTPARAAANRPAGSSHRDAIPALLDAPVFELVVFVVRDGGALLFATDAFRREFVLRRLAHRLPVVSAADIDRIEVIGGPDDQHSTLRVFCLVRFVPPRG